MVYKNLSLVKGAAAAWEKNRSRSRFGKKSGAGAAWGKKAGAGAAKNVSCSQAIKKKLS